MSAKQYTEEELITGCRNGDSVYQEALYTTYSRLMMGICIRYLPNRMDAEDVFHETFVKLFEKIKTFKGGSLKSWMCKIFVNASIDAYREVKKQYMHVNYDDVNPITDDHLDVLGKLSVEELHRTIAELPEGYKVVFNLFIVDGFSHKEIADKLNITEGTSKSQLYKAKAMLVKMLEQKNITRYAIG